MRPQEPSPVGANSTLPPFSRMSGTRKRAAKPRTPRSPPQGSGGWPECGLLDSRSSPRPPEGDGTGLRYPARPADEPPRALRDLSAGPQARDIAVVTTLGMYAMPRATRSTVVSSETLARMHDPSGIPNPPPRRSNAPLRHAGPNREVDLCCAGARRRAMARFCVADAPSRRTCPSSSIEADRMTQPGRRND